MDFPRIFWVICVVFLYAVTPSAGQGDPTRIPSPVEQAGLTYEANLQHWPVCADKCTQLRAAWTQSTERWCTLTSGGICTQVGNFIRVDRFCAALNTTGCPPSVCLIPPHSTEYLSWYRAVCFPGPDGWTQLENLRAERENAFNRLIPSTSFVSPPNCTTPCREFSDLYSNSSFSETCIDIDWRGCVNSTAYVNTTRYCEGLSTLECPTDICLITPWPTTLVQWATSTCNFSTEARQRWNDTIEQRAQRFSSLIPDRNFTSRRPPCSSRCQGLSDLHNASLFFDSCLSKRSGVCIPSLPYVNATRYCAGLENTEPCPDSCTFATEPRLLYSSLNAICGSRMRLPDTWRNATLEKEQRWLPGWLDGLLPWRWTVQAHREIAEPSSTGIRITDPLESSTPFVSVRPSGPGSCPSSTSEKLGVFAAVNVMSACLLPILGRRTIVHRLTLGFGGRLGSRAWPFLGVLHAALHIASNLINARIIRATPGYGNVPFASLALLWCTRPRLSWMAVFLARWRADEALYVNSAASAIVSEAILQVISAVYFGKTAHYAEGKGFYTVGSLDSSYPRAKYAYTMYAGALFWMILVFFALLACLLSIMGLGKVITNARNMVANWGYSYKAAPALLEPPRKLYAGEFEDVRSVTQAWVLFFVYLAQWLFWAGFVKTAGERYCPPKLATLGAVWGLFSATGIFVGSVH